MIFISVDLPAPFSPRTACVSPGCTVSDTSLLATTEGKRLVMCASCSRGMLKGGPPSGSGPQPGGDGLDALAQPAAGGGRMAAFVPQLVIHEFGERHGTGQDLHRQLAQ